MYNARNSTCHKLSQESITCNGSHHACDTCHATTSSSLTLLPSSLSSYLTSLFPIRCAWMKSTSATREGMMSCQKGRRSSCNRRLFCHALNGARSSRSACFAIYWLQPARRMTKNMLDTCINLLASYLCILFLYIIDTASMAGHLKLSIPSKSGNFTIICSFLHA